MVRREGREGYCVTQAAEKNWLRLAQCVYSNDDLVSLNNFIAPLVSLSDLRCRGKRDGKNIQLKLMSVSARYMKCWAVKTHERSARLNSEEPLCETIKTTLRLEMKSFAKQCERPASQLVPASC